MRIQITNIYTDKTRLVEGTPVTVERELLFYYPFARPEEGDSQDLLSTIKRIHRAQLFSVQVDWGSDKPKTDDEIIEEGMGGGKSDNDLIEDEMGDGRSDDDLIESEMDNKEEPLLNKSIFDIPAGKPVVQKPMAVKHGLDYHAPKIRQPDPAAPKDYDDAYGKYSYAIKSENLEKAITDLGVGPQIPHPFPEQNPKSKNYDYSHLLAPEHRAAGYRMNVEDHPDTSTKVRLYPPGDNHSVGHLTGSLNNKNAYAGLSELNSEHKGKGIGTSMYEAFYAHMKNHHGATHGSGGVHSTLAHKVHQRVAARHGLNYSAEQIAPSSKTGDFDDAYGPYKQALKSESSDNEAAIHQLGFTAHEMPEFAAASFLSGRPTMPDAARAALWHADGDIRVAALVAHGLEPSEANLKALDATQKLSKSDTPTPDPPTPQSIVAAFPSGEDVAENVRAAFRDKFVFPVNLSGKHSDGSLLARDEESDTVWLLKPGANGQTTAAGADQDKSSQSAREAVFYHVAKEWGLFSYVPRAELLIIDSKPVAALHFLGTDFKPAVKFSNLRDLLHPLLKAGILHQLAFLDGVLGNADSHLNNTMLSRRIGQSDNTIAELRLIDHGSALAGNEFDPAHDQNSFVPGYLRAWSPTTFNKLPTKQKLDSLPRVSAGEAKRLGVWIASLLPDWLQYTLQLYGVDPAPSLGRLAKLQADAKTMPADLAINRFWVTV